MRRGATVNPPNPFARLHIEEDAEAELNRVEPDWSPPTPGTAFYPNTGGENHIRLAFSYESPEKCYEGARLIGKAILDARTTV